MGRPQIEITEEVINQAYELAKKGLSRKQIAISLGMGLSTLHEKMNKFPDFLEAIEQGSTDGIKEVVNALFNKAVEGNVQAIQTFLYNRDQENWKREPQESAIRDIPPINITMITDATDKAAD